jgi:hypothetical protein
MKSIEIIKKYAYYIDSINKIAELELKGYSTVRKLNLNRGTIQRAYAEIEDLKFKGTIQDYICWISALYLFQLLEAIKPVDEYKPEEFPHILENVLMNNPRELYCFWQLVSHNPEVFNELITEKLGNDDERYKQMVEVFQQVIVKKQVAEAFNGKFKQVSNG